MHDRQISKGEYTNVRNNLHPPSNPRQFHTRTLQESTTPPHAPAKCPQNHPAPTHQKPRPTHILRAITKRTQLRYACPNSTPTSPPHLSFCAPTLYTQPNHDHRPGSPSRLRTPCLHARALPPVAVACHPRHRRAAFSHGGRPQRHLARQQPPHRRRSRFRRRGRNLLPALVHRPHRRLRRHRLHRPHLPRQRRAPQKPSRKRLRPKRFSRLCARLASRHRSVSRRISRHQYHRPPAPSA